MVLRLSSFEGDVRGAALTGLSLAASTAIAATDNVLVALGKLQGQVTALGSGSFPITCDFSAGLTVVAGTYRLLGTAAFPFTINSLDYEVGSAGGSFTVAVQISGTNVTGLSAVAVSSATKANAAATAAKSVAAGQRVALVVSNVSGAPADAVLTLLCTR